MRKFGVILIVTFIMQSGNNLSAQPPKLTQGNHRRGMALFAQKGCASCHAVDGKSISLGPDLTKLEKFPTRDEFKESIEQPSKKISKGYDSYTAILESGKVLTGRIVDQSKESVTFMFPKNLVVEKQTVKRDEIIELVKSDVSVMPKGLMKGLKDSNVDDLLAYLQRMSDPNYKEPAPAKIPPKTSGVTSEPVDADVTFYSPEESMKRIQVASGYRLELVAAEPMIEEPVLCVWDGNGRMYVAEMRTYMQDADATDQDLPRSRVSILEDTDGDGKMDKVSRFVDDLVLPRMILPLDDRIIINETYTRDYYSYRDTDGDGVADEKILLYGGGKTGGNLEHQDSGMTWGIDNWIYTAQTGNMRHRFTQGEWKTERLYSDNGQWGLAMDDVGRFFLSAAGGEKPAYGFQQLPHYGKLKLPEELERDFERVYPIVKMDDVQGGTGRIDQERKGLNRFTGCAGQSIYRGDQMPADFQGNYILPEPVGRLVRRAKVTQIEGKYVLSNAYEKSEFIASTDKNFRPLWSATGPDGCLYIVDMYRGIIQEGNWTNKGSYLRGIIDRDGFAKNIGRGRIYRVVHESTKRQPTAKMLELTSKQLVEQLSHPNGWRRDTAQKLLVLRDDKAVVPSLEKLAASGKSPLGRMHAFWTLDGLGSVSKDSLVAGLSDSDPRVRMAAMRISEPILAENPELAEKVIDSGYHDDVAVTVQAVNSLRYASPEQRTSAINELVAAYHTNDLVLTSAQMSLRYREGGGGPSFANLDPKTLELMKQGYQSYTLLCIRCHGPDGNGAISSDGLQLAPSLAGSPRLVGSSELPTRIVLHGLTGLIDGKKYPGQMESMKRQDDKWIASVLTYVRNSFGNSASPITPEDVARVRRETQGRSQPYRMEDLAEFLPINPETQRSWLYSSSISQANPLNAVDGDPETRFDTGASQSPGQWFQFDMGTRYELTGLVLDTTGSKNDYPREYVLRFSDDGLSWSEPMASGEGTNPITSISFNNGSAARFVRITQTSEGKTGLFWSIHELSVFGRPAKPDTSVSDLDTIPLMTDKKNKLRVLLVDGQNNHDWKSTTPIMKKAFEKSGYFTVDVSTTPESGKDVSTFKPDFDKYQAIVLNYNGAMWSPKTRQAFVEYVRKGGGVSIVHAANNAFTGWPEYNDMIGIGWRGAEFGTRIVVDDKTGDYLRIPAKTGPGAGHGSFHSFVVKSRESEHPIMKGFPLEWRHARDELYHGLRGPAKNVQILASAYSSKDSGGTGEHEPIVMTIDFGKGRIFHTPMGHALESMRGPGFQSVLLRGTEWAATGKVTIPAPSHDILPMDEALDFTLAEIQELKLGKAIYDRSCLKCHGRNGPRSC